MKRIILTITRYDVPEEDTAIPTRSRDMGYDSMRNYPSNPMPSPNVLTIDVDETQYEAIKKAALETF